MSRAVGLARTCFGTALIGWALSFLPALLHYLGLRPPVPIRVLLFLVVSLLLFLARGVYCGVRSLFQMEPGERRNVLHSALLGIFLNVSLACLVGGGAVVTLFTWR